MINSMGMRWEGHVERMGRNGMYIGCWCESQKERDQEVNEWTILRWALER
jgi:hypothetical protein